MNYVTTRKTSWNWHEADGTLTVSLRANVSWTTKVDADIRSEPSPQITPAGRHYHATLPGWRLQQILNNAYERGRAEALEDLRGLQ